MSRRTAISKGYQKSLATSGIVRHLQLMGTLSKFFNGLLSLFVSHNALQ